VLSADLEWIYGAALCASSDEESAADATRAAVQRPGGGESRRELMARAVAHALVSSPADPLGALTAPEREAIGLARIVGMSVDEIAEFTGRAAGDVKSSMLSGLKRLAGGLSAAGAV
jgi:DNA-directed RNA polymerase specialized sigma24 family protein